MSAPTAAGKLLTYSMVSLFATALTVSVGYCWWNSANTMPTIQGFQDKEEEKEKEGFAGPAVGAGLPDCMSTCKECAELYHMLSKHSVITEEGPDDLREIQLILSKLSCFKRDLLGNAKVVQATRYQAFSTSHDLEPVAETAARCFAKTSCSVSGPLKTLPP